MQDELRYPHIRAAIASMAWAILPDKFAEIQAFIAFAASGGKLTADELDARLGARPDRQRGRAAGEVAVLPILGTIAHRADLLTESSGGASVERLTREFRALLHDPDVSAIVLDIDSPGGSVDGIDEFATEIYRARNVKPITAVANTLMASAAYWLGSAASEVVVTPSAEVGSIGVIAGHTDQSALNEKLGVKVSLVTAGKYKAENNPFEPMTDEGRAAIQKRVDEAYGRFTRAVAKGRGVPIDTVRGGFGEGRVVSAREAVSLGMADRVATIDEVIADLARRPRTTTESSPSAMTAGLVAVPYEEHGQRVLADLSAFVQATRDRIAYRRDTEPDRAPLSDAHRERLSVIGRDIAALLAETAPAPVPTYDRRRARIIDALLAEAGVEVI